MLKFQIKKDPLTDTIFLETSLSGKPLLTTPQLNKGTAFTEEERDMFGITGKLPSHIETLEEQVKRTYLQYISYETPLQKNIFLNKLHDSNQVLFYKLMENHLKEMISIVYTPTVGIAVEKFSREFQQARGLYISYTDIHKIEAILDNRSNPEIDLIVVSDGAGVLGIGDQGVGAMMIPVAKLMVYTICGGISPLRTLPILLDVGTDNEKLLNDPFYLGCKHPRITGQDYDNFIEVFITAVKKKFPHVFLQWEDFGLKTARVLLERYQNKICSFNDDIQGTGATALAALIAAIGATKSTFTQQRFVIFGGGTAGTGIADQIFNYLIKIGLSQEEAYQYFWIVDKSGLLLETTPDLTPAQKPYAKKLHDIQDWKLDISHPIYLETLIHHLKPTVLIGCSAVKNAFTATAIKEMASYVRQPIIFPLSNPTEKAEATPKDLIEWTNGKALIATGSPFSPIEFQGKMYPISQCNNALVFPGIGLGVIVGQATKVTDSMIWAACFALNQCAPIHKDPLGSLLPTLNDAKNTSREIAIAVAKQAYQDGVSTLIKIDDIAEKIDAYRWEPKYVPFFRRFF